MGFLNFLGGKSGGLLTGVIGYGQTKKDGSHDHRTNRGNDRTPAQKQGDKKLGSVKVEKF